MMWIDLQQGILEDFAEVAVAWRRCQGAPPVELLFFQRKRGPKPHFVRTEESRRYRAKNSPSKTKKPRTTVVIQGVTYAFPHACKLFGVNPATARGRIALGWSVEKAFGKDS